MIVEVVAAAASVLSTSLRGDRQHRLMIERVCVCAAAAGKKQANLPGERNSLSVAGLLFIKILRASRDFGKSIAIAVAPFVSRVEIRSGATSRTIQRVKRGAFRGGHFAHKRRLFK